MGIFSKHQAKMGEAKQVFDNNMAEHWQKERAKYQAKLDQLLADGKGDSGQAGRTRKVIARCERKLAELS